MAQPKKPKNPQEKFSATQLNKLLGLMGPQQAHNFALRHFGTRKPRFLNAFTIRMQCPVHDDGDASFDINTQQSWVHCFGCHYHSRNFLQFLQDSLGWSYSEGAQHIQDQTGIRVFSEKSNAKIEAVEIHRLATRFIMEACNRYAQDCVVFWKTGVSPNENLYTASTLEGVRGTLVWLFDERRHNPDMLPDMPYGILPAFHICKPLVGGLIEEFNERNRLAGRAVMDLKKVEKIVARVNELLGNLDTVWVNAVTFHTGYAMNVPGRIRLRRPRAGAKDIHALPGFDDNDPIGVFGLYRAYSALTGKELKKLAPWIVEGENDCISVLERLWAAGKRDLLVFATGGSQGDLDMLCDAGFARAFMVADDPDGGGGTEFLRGRVQTALELDLRIFNNWRALRAPGVKDPDEAISHHGFQKFYDEVFANPEAYVTIDVWAREQALEEFVRLEDQDDVREKNRIAADWGKLVKHPALQQQYVKEVAKAFDIHAGTIQHEILKQQDTEESFILRIAETLRRDYHVVFKEDDGRSSYLVLFHKEKGRVVRLSMHDGEAAAIQLANIHGPITDFFRNVVGLPMFLSTAEGLEASVNQQPVKQYYKPMCDYLKVALQHLYVGVLDRRLCKELGQGVHYVSDPYAPEKKCAYVVNGTDVFKIEYDDGAHLAETAPPVTATKLAGPSDGHYVFNIGFESPVDPWSREIRTVDDVLATNAMDVTPHLRRISQLFETHWHFRHQHLDAQFLAYHLFAAGVSTAFATQVMVAFLGDTHSGKTSVLNIFSGVSSRPMQLLEASAAVSNFTQAAIYQKWNNSTIALAIDEFEDEGDLTHKAKQVADVVTLLRQLVNEEGIPIERGGKDGTMKTYRVRAFVFLAAIKQARQVQDMNRRHEIEMNKIPGHRDAKAGVLSEMSIEQFHEIRRAVSLGLLRWIPRLQQLGAEIEKELLSKQVVGHNVNNRTLKNFVPAAAIAALVGDDWRKFVRESCEARRQKHDAIAAETTSQVIYDRVFFTASIPTPTNRAVKLSLNELLAAEENWNQINSSGVGFFFIPEMKVGVVHWITAQTSLLAPWHEYTGTHHRTLKDAFDRHPNAIRMEDYEKLGVWPHIQRLIPAARKADVSVVDLTKFIEDASGRGGTPQSGAGTPGGTTAAPTTPAAPPQAPPAPTATADEPQKEESPPHAVDNLP